MQGRRCDCHDDIRDGALGRTIDDLTGHDGSTLRNGRRRDQHSHQRNRRSGEQVSGSAAQHHGGPQAALLVQEIHRVLPQWANITNSDAPYTRFSAVLSIRTFRERHRIDTSGGIVSRCFLWFFTAVVLLVTRQRRAPHATSSQRRFVRASRRLALQV
ncbi:Hypothetical protein A7982_03141 [Minicystis rosea]|nr:Hypothetical protein A7982_03141 [Minicystis rosea]